MSGSNSPLIGDDEELVAARWRTDKATGQQRRKARISIHVVVLTLLTPLTVLLILYLQWQSAFWIPTVNPVQSTDSIAAKGPLRDLKVLLHPEENISRPPSIRKYSWNITKSIITPNGVEKEVFLINNQFPGPTIEARSGDTLEIEVLNLSEEGISLHWHGLYMRGANHMDGPVGITQCPISPGNKFTYQVPIGDQSGTFWYHAHSEVQRGDGLYGGLIVHNPQISEKELYQYDSELLLLVGDWYHWPSARVLDFFMSRTSTGNEPCPDSLLINGMGQFECSMATHGAPVNCTEIERPWLQLDKSRRYRVRVVNVGSLTGFVLSIPDSEMSVIQLDGGQVAIHDIPATAVGTLYPAERMDLVVSWLEAGKDTDTEITIALDKEYFIRPNAALTPTQSFLLAAGSETRQALNSTTEVVRFDLRDVQGIQLTSPVPEPQTHLMIYASIEILNRLGSRPKSFLNRTTWEPQDLPLIAMDRDDWNDHQLVPWTGAEPGWVELTINNIDATGHPFHLHGFDFYVVGIHAGNGGWDYYSPFDSRPPRGGPFNLANPVKKDTVWVPPWGYVVVRFLADNPGIWALHCHIMWHQASGMTMALQVLGDEATGLRSTEMGESAQRLCGA
ncbi:iron transport multicopper oxidase fet3 [Xylariales sp. PMI_506]|nr:iron transport multicopper oxidase fet3 [Xylariales sp. PMI_506]